MYLPSNTTNKSRYPLPLPYQRPDSTRISALRRRKKLRSAISHEFEISRPSRDYIRWVQSSLNKILKRNLAVDGKSGSMTRSAIRDFQRQKGLNADSRVGAITEQALVDAGASMPPMNTSSTSPTYDLDGIDPDSFVAVSVENPGGQRIKNKTAPRSADIVNIRGIGRQYPLHRLAANAWKHMVTAARRDGIEEPFLRLTSGYRDPEHQRRLWERALKQYGSRSAARKWVAPPGGSPHQSGRAVDLYLGGRNSSANVNNLRKKKAYKWLLANAERFGFYPYSNEPWHWEYNPPKNGILTASTGRPTIKPHTTTPHPPSMITGADEIVYSVNINKPYGPHWRSTKPPGLPASTRRASTPGAALPYVERLARAKGLGEVFSQTVKHLSQTESGGTFARPANIFNALPKEQRPPGRNLITAWGAFQFNRGAWRSLPGVSHAASPWQASIREELEKPIDRYAALFRSIKSAGGNDVAAARSIRLWHRTPTGFKKYLRNGRSNGFAFAWRATPSRHRNPVDAHLSAAGVL